MKGSAWIEDTCLYCGTHVGAGALPFHIGVCDSETCQRKAYGPDPDNIDDAYAEKHYAALQAARSTKKGE